MKKTIYIKLAFIFLLILLISACSDNNNPIAGNTGADPRIIGIYPSNSALNIPVDSQYMVAFSVPMDTASCEQYFNAGYMHGMDIMGNMMHEFVDGEFHWNMNHDTMYYEPHNHMMGNMMHSMEFHEGMVDHVGNPLHDQDGNMVSGKYTVSFTTK